MDRITNSNVHLLDTYIPFGDQSFGSCGQLWIDVNIHHIFANVMIYTKSKIQTRLETSSDRAPLRLLSKTGIIITWNKQTQVQSIILIALICQGYQHNNMRVFVFAC